jgi:pectate lyase-like protein
MITKIAMIAITATFIANIANAQVGLNSLQATQQSIKTIYPTKDWVISDFVVTDPRFGAKAHPGFDNRAAFQAAIDAAYKNGGGVVYIPAGNYEFRSTQTATKSVRVRQGSEQIMKDFNYQYVLNIPTSVQLRGDWADPELNRGKVLGTILEVRVGKNAPNYNGTVESWWNDEQVYRYEFGDRRDEPVNLVS